MTLAQLSRYSPSVSLDCKPLEKMVSSNNPSLTIPDCQHICHLAYALAGVQGGTQCWRRTYMAHISV
ncbi:hypothetical protein B0I35DRAFT_61298 [Stachybotrys elegans]|uniref:Uncharacterized protein n=1 Tax=Stachybotrys elegans TaxID=80388 RepID=A0A8K0SN44_9HYPO|nr:hypothetical protein B0I35DRAFT_61298 [Stachybotrys elegans]